MTSDIDYQKRANRSKGGCLHRLVKYILDFRSKFMMLFYLLSVPVCLITFFLSWFNPFLWPLLIGYVIYILLDPAPENGGRSVSFIRNLFFWKWLADYFPTTLIKECELDPRGNYIFGYHPHGITSSGVFINFLTNVNDVDGKFSGQNIRVLMYEEYVKMPYLRELLLFLGGVKASVKSLNNIMCQGPGNSCLVVVGEVEESLSNQKDELKLVFAEKFGFIRQAIEHGADLVPVFGFGENQTYNKLNNEQGTIIRSIQTFIGKFTNLVPHFSYGRAFFTRYFGFMPYRVPLVTIVGKPIEVTQCNEPSEDLILHYQKLYCHGLTDLYNRNKDEYWVGGNPPQIEFI